MNDELETARSEASDLRSQKHNGHELRWRCHPMKRRPWVTIAVTAFVGLVAVLVYYATEHSQAFATLALVVMFASLAKFYFPTKYKLTDKHVIVKTTTQTLTKEWAQYRSCHTDKNGILLSPFTRPTRLENFRGLYLMFANNRDVVIAFVKAHLATKAVDASVKDKEPEA